MSVCGFGLCCHDQIFLSHDFILFHFNVVITFCQIGEVERCHTRKGGVPGRFHNFNFVVFGRCHNRKTFTSRTAENAFLWLGEDILERGFPAEIWTLDGLPRVPVRFCSGPEGQSLRCTRGFVRWEPGILDPNPGFRVFTLSNLFMIWLGCRVGVFRFSARSKSFQNEFWITSGFPNRIQVSFFHREDRII